MDTAVLLKELTEASGPSGYEAEIREIVQKHFRQYTEGTRTDSLGNIIGLKSGKAGAGKRRIMLAAHMDEIALMVSQIEKGFLRIVEIGGFDARVLVGQEVTVHGRKDLPGVIVSVPPHFSRPEDRDKTVPLEKLFVDVGLSPSQVDSGIVRVGDVVTLSRSFTALNGKRVSGKALDDRAGVASVIVCLRELSRLQHDWDVYAVATVQEEETRFGAATSAYHLEPDVALAVDVTFGEQPGTPDADTYKLDGGPTVAFGPNIHPKIFASLVAAAQAEEMPYQVEPIAGDTGTDGWVLQVSRAGIPTGVLGIPVRYMHTPVETVVLRDVERTGRLMASFISRLNKEGI